MSATDVASSGMRGWTVLFRLARLATIVAAIAITILSLIPHELLFEPRASDKLRHIAAYALLATCATVAWPHRRDKIIALSLIILLGCILELAQSVVPGRVADVADIAANIFGVGIGTVIGWTFVRLLVRNSRVEL